MSEEALRKSRHHLRKSEKNELPFKNPYGYLYVQKPQPKTKSQTTQDCRRRDGDASQCCVLDYACLGDGVVKLLIIALPISSGICGTTALPKHPSLSICEGIP